MVALHSIIRAALPVENNVSDGVEDKPMPKLFIVSVR